MRDPRPPYEIVVLSGPIAAGKSTLGDGLRRSRNATVLATRGVLAHWRGLPVERDRLIAAGDELDRETSGRWVADALTELMAEQGGSRPSVLFVVDAARRSIQIDRIRERFEHVFHVHLLANETELARRYATRGEVLAFDDARAGATERAVGDLATLADLVLDSSRLDAVEVLRQTLQGQHARDRAGRTAREGHR